MGPFVPLLALIMAFSLAASLQLIQLVKRALGVEPVINGLRIRDLEEFRILRRCLGLRVEELRVQSDGDWTSADHLMFYNGERPDEQTGLWKRPQWPGSRAGQGGAAYDRWRYGDRTR